MPSPKLPVPLTGRGRGDILIREQIDIGRVGIAHPKVSNGLEKGGREEETVKEVGVKKREEGGIEERKKGTHTMQRQSHDHQ